MKNETFEDWDLEKTESFLKYCYSKKGFLRREEADMLYSLIGLEHSDCSKRTQRVLIRKPHMENIFHKIYHKNPDILYV